MISVGNKILMPSSSKRPPIIVTIPIQTNPYPYISYNLGTSFFQGNQISAITAIRSMEIGYEIRNCIAIINSGNTSNFGLFSTNEGSSWQTAPNIAPRNYAFGTGISPTGLAMFWARSHITELLYGSWDSGNTVSQISINLDGPRNIATNYDGSSFFTCGQYNSDGKYTTNSGGTFTSFSSPYDASSVDCSEDFDRWYIAQVGTGSNPYYSTNHGSTWVAATGVTLSNDYYIRCNKSNGKYVLLVNTSYAYLSSDYGVSFSRILSSVAAFTGVHAFSISYSGKYMVISSNDAGEMFVSSDFGSSWSTINVSGVSYKFTAIAIQE